MTEGVIAKKEENSEAKKATAELYFGKDSTIRTDKLRIASDVEVTVTLKGKIVSFSRDPNSWEPGTRIKLELQSCDIEQEKNIDSLDAALENANQSRKIM